MKDNSLMMYQNFTALYESNVMLKDVLSKLGIDKAYIYGLGKFGKLAISCLKDDNVVAGISDIKIQKTAKTKHSLLGETMEYRPCDIPDDENPIIVTVASSYYMVRKSLEKAGIKPERLWTLNSLIILARYFACDKLTSSQYGRKPEFLIVGANFLNKGSQAMAFVAMNEIRDKYNNAIVWCCPNCWESFYNNGKYRLVFLEDGYEIESTVNEIIPRLTAIIDVSGYAFSSREGFGKTDRVMNFMRMAYDYNVPFFLMPQSFGPLDYPGYKLAELGELLKSCKKIFAREKAGFDLLKTMFRLTNLELSDDMVLQSRPVNMSNIYTDIYVNRISQIDDTNCVGIIPNRNLLFYLGKEELIDIYTHLINALLKENLNVYIIPHSDDQGICDDIYSKYSEDARVNYESKDFSCIEFGQYIKQFRFVIASRYHAIVHAYKMAIPCIILGWADKYNELAELMGQKEYLLDIRELQIDMKMIDGLLGKMIDSCEKEKDVIRSKNGEIQARNCFDKVWKSLPKFE